MSEKITLLEDDDDDLNDDVAPEYDFSKMRRATEQEQRFRAQATRRLVSLAPDVSEAFHTSEEVNEALRKILREKKAV